MKTRQLWLNVLLILLPTVFGLELLCWISVLPRMARGEADFRQLYVSGYMVRTGAASRLYDYAYQLQLQNARVAPAQSALPYIRPPYQALLFAPLSLLSFRAAYFLWLAVNAALVALSCYLLRRRFAALSAIWKPLPFAVLCSFFPVSLALLGGQDSIELLALLSAALVALEHNHDALAGCLLALGLFKFQIVLPIAFLFVLWKRWKFAQGFFSTALLLAGISLALIGRPGIQSFYRTLAHIHIPVHYRIMTNLHALLVGIAGDSRMVTFATLALSAALSLAVARWSRAQSGPDALMIAIATAALVSYYLYGHDACILVLPLLFAMNAGVNRPLDGWAGLLMFAAPLVCIFALDYSFWATLPMALLLFAAATSTQFAPANLLPAEAGGSEGRVAHPLA